MRKIQMVDTKNQYLAIKKEVDESIQGVLDSASYINGKAVQDFSQSLASYLQVSHVIPCANGTDALQIAMMALGLKPGDEVIAPSFTYIATFVVHLLFPLPLKFQSHNLLHSTTLLMLAHPWGNNFPRIQYLEIRNASQYDHHFLFLFAPYPHPHPCVHIIVRFHS